MKYAQPNLIVGLIRDRTVKHRMMLDDDDSFMMEAMLPLYAKMRRAQGKISDEWRLLKLNWLIIK